MKIPIFYNPNQNAKSNKAYSPSAGKPTLALESFQQTGVPIEVMDFKPLKASHIALAHDPAFVHQVLACKRPNGFGNTNPEVAASLPYTSGSFFAAAVHALKTGTVACSLTSGFHHAGYDNAGGFCTFNGLMITERMLRLHGLKGRVGIIDLDAHYGDGTSNILSKFSAFNDNYHYSFSTELSQKGNSDKWLESLLPSLNAEYRHCKILLVQLGADPHVEDPLGGYLTTEQMRERDRIVFEFAKKNGIPVVWNLAGGYQEPIRKVLDLHDQSLIECYNVYKGT